MMREESFCIQHEHRLIACGRWGGRGDGGVGSEAEMCGYLWGV